MHPALSFDSEQTQLAQKQFEVLLHIFINSFFYQCKAHKPNAYAHAYTHTFLYMCAHTTPALVHVCTLTLNGLPSSTILLLMFDVILYLLWKMQVKLIDHISELDRAMPREYGSFTSHAYTTPCRRVGGFVHEYVNTQPYKCIGARLFIYGGLDVRCVQNEIFALP